MKITSLHWVATLAFVLVTSSATATFAQTTPAPAPEKHHHGMEGVLTPDEKKQLMADREKVFASDPALKTDSEALKAKFKAASTPADKKALKEELKAQEAKMRAAILKIDPSAAPIFAKLDAARAKHQENRG